MRENLITEVKEIYDDLVDKLIHENKRAEIFCDLNIFLKPGFDNKAGLMESIASANNIDLKRNNLFLGKEFDYDYSVIDLIFLKGPESGYFIRNFKEKN